jgi:hypothetical protein
VDAWTFIWLMVILKIPVIALLLLVRWAVKQEPYDPQGEDEDGGISVDPHPRHPSHPRPRLPRSPRRGPHHGAPAPLSPPRVRGVVAHARLTRH